MFGHYGIVTAYESLRLKLPPPADKGAIRNLSSWLACDGLGGPCSAGRTFRGALAVVVGNPSAGCGPVTGPTANVGVVDPLYDDVVPVDG